MMKRMFSILIALCLGICACAVAEVEESFALIGEWAFGTDTAALVLRVSEDGTAWYQDTECEWEDLGEYLRLSDSEGVELLLRYEVYDDQKVIYPQTVYRRTADVEDQGGLIGVWESISDGSSFVFTPAGYFLEDSVFSGNFSMDPEAGTFLLHYGEAFADTLCFYSIENDEQLTVEYPWTIVPLEK